MNNLKKLKSKYLSRKFILAIVAGLVVFANKAFDLELNLEEVLVIVGSLLSFVLVEGISDIRGRK